jgi:acyl-CoA synthetase (AMP-forming)/AMP-acid ligase II
MGSTLEALGLRLMLVEDTAATARTRALRTPVRASHQRFGNKSNSKSSLKIEKVENVTYAANGVSSPPAVVSRAHFASDPKQKEQQVRLTTCHAPRTHVYFNNSIQLSIALCAAFQRLGGANVSFSIALANSEIATQAAC